MGIKVLQVKDAAAQMSPEMAALMERVYEVLFRGFREAVQPYLGAENLGEVQSAALSALGSFSIQAWVLMSFGDLNMLENGPTDMAKIIRKEALEKATRMLADLEPGSLIQ